MYLIGLNHLKKRQKNEFDSEKMKDLIDKMIKEKKIKEN